MSHGDKSCSDQIVLEEVVDEAYEPTDKEIEEYANWLGLDVDKEKKLLWIAREGLKAPLPQDWKPCQDADGELYYFNFITGESIWDHPCDKYYKDLYKREKTKESMLGPEEKTPPSSPLTTAPKTLSQISPLSGHLGKAARLQPLAPIGGSSPPLAPLRGALPPVPGSALHQLLAPARTTQSMPKSQAVQPTTPVSRGGTSTSSTTPSSEWRRTVSPRSVAEQDEIRAVIDKERKSWKEKQEKDFEDWKQKFQAESERERKQLENNLSDLNKELEEAVAAAKNDLAAQEARSKQEHSTRQRDLEREFDEKFEKAKETLATEYQIKLDTFKRHLENSNQEEERIAKELLDKTREETRAAEKVLQSDLADDLRAMELRLREKHQADVKDLREQVERSLAAEMAALVEKLETEKTARLEECKKERQQQIENEVQTERNKISSIAEQMRSGGGCTSSTDDDDPGSDIETLKASLRDKHDSERARLEEQLQQDIDSYRLELKRNLEKEKVKLEEDLRQSIECARGMLEIKEKEEHERLQLEYGQRVKAMIEKFDRMEKEQDPFSSMVPNQKTGIEAPCKSQTDTAQQNKPMLSEKTASEPAQAGQIVASQNCSSESKRTRQGPCRVDPENSPEGVPDVKMQEPFHQGSAWNDSHFFDIKDAIVGTVQKSIEEALEQVVALRMPSVIHDAKQILDASLAQGIRRAIELEMPRVLQENLKAINDQMHTTKTMETMKSQETPSDSEGCSSDGSISEVESHVAVTHTQKTGPFKPVARVHNSCSKRIQTSDSAEVGNDGRTPATLSLETAKRFVRLQKRMIKKRRVSLEAARKNWMMQWRDLACEPDSGVLHAKQAVLQDMWVALEGQARRLNTDIGGLQNLKTRLRSLGAFLERHTDTIPLATDGPGCISDLLGGLCGGRSIEVLNQLLTR